MNLTSPLLLGLVAALAVSLPILMIVGWGRRPRGISGRLLRLVGIVLRQLLAVGAIGLYALRPDAAAVLRLAGAGGSRVGTRVDRSGPKRNS